MREGKSSNKDMGDAFLLLLFVWLLPSYSM